MSDKAKKPDFHVRCYITRNGNQIRLECLPVRLENFDIDYGATFPERPGLHGLRTDGVMYLHDPGDHITWYGLDQFFYTDIYRVYGPAAEMMAKSLKRYNGALIATHGKLGYPASMGQAVQWVVITLGAAGVVLENEPYSPIFCRNGAIASTIMAEITKLQGDQAHG